MNGSVSHLSFLARLLLALRAFIKVLFEPEYAKEVSLQLHAGSATIAAAADPIASEKAPPVGRDMQPGFDATTRGALGLLKLLQREGRFVDFVMQEVEGFSDADVGAAARVVHRGCRSVLRQQMTLSAVSSVPEDERVSLEDSREVQSGSWKLTGNLASGPPHRGVVKHTGWQVERCQLPEAVGSDDARIVCPAELEVS